MKQRVSLVGRVTWAATLIACAAALLAASATSVLADYMLQDAEDRRLREAAVILAAELDEDAPSPDLVAAVVRAETEETRHTGLVFAVLDQGGRRLAGDARIAFASGSPCALNAADDLRLCTARSARGMTAVAASAHALPTSLFVASALIASAFAAAAAWAVSRPLSRTAVAPLARLRARLAAIDVDAGSQTDLGPAEGVHEVDELRATTAQLLGRVHQAVDNARRYAVHAAHELRTPLTTARAELELLAEEEGPEASSAVRLGRVELCVADLAQIVDSLLILATPRSAPGDASEAVSLRDLVDDAIASMPVPSRAQISTDEGDVLVRGDAALLATLATNALTNAVKFAGSARVSVFADGAFAVLCFDDDGPGVPPAERERVFEPFQRGRDAQQRRVPGTGLGLALVRHIAEAHGGRATLGDVDGRGARLEIRLPRVDDA